MTEFLADLQYWHWWVLGIVCLTLEIFAPGAIFIWFAASAGVLGFLVLLLPDLSWQVQITLFSILSIISILSWHKYRQKVPESNPYPTLNKRGEELVGRSFTLDEPIVNNYGKIRVDDTMWKINGPNAEVGQQIKVVSIDGTILKVDVS